MVKTLIASTLLIAVLFSIIAMTTATILIAFGELTGDQWLQALGSCVTLCGFVVGKRAVDGIGKAVVARKNGDQ
jgi:hypothetical protein